MRMLELTTLYLVVGLGISVALVLKAQASKLDVALLLPFWPLYAPVLLVSRIPELTRAPTVTGLLAPAEVFERLEERLKMVQGRVSELDQLLREPAICLQTAKRRARELRQRGDVRAAASAEGRQASIQRLHALRARYVQELVEVEELMAQLRVQQEVVRRLGRPPADAQDLMFEVEARIEGLEQIVEADAWPDS